MLDVREDQLLIDVKGIYSVEKFIVARRLMYWQVYLHRTVVASEQLLVLMLKRAQALSSMGVELFATPALAYFLQEQKQVSLEQFYLLDDEDILASSSHSPQRSLSNPMRFSSVRTARRNASSSSRTESLPLRWSERRSLQRPSRQSATVPSSASAGD